MRKVVILLMLIIAGTTLFGQKTMQIEKYEEKDNRFVPSMDESSGLVVFYSPMKLAFSSNMDTKVDIYNEEFKAGLHIYYLRFDKGVRRITVEAEGYLPVTEQVTVKVKDVLRYRVFDPEKINKIIPRSLWFEYNYSYTAPLGITVGYGRKIGGYLRWKYAFNPEGEVEVSGKGENVFLEGLDKKGYIRNSITGGVMIALSKWCYLYAGAGYGKYGILWDSNTGVKLTTDKITGVEAEGGLAFRLGNFSLSGGANVICGKETMCDFNVGIGYFFNIKNR